MKINTYDHIQRNISPRSTPAMAFNQISTGNVKVKKYQGLTNVNQSDLRDYKGNRIQAVKNSINKLKS